jgi:hypothetical protein
MVLLRRVKSYSCRSSTSAERSQHSTLVGKTGNDGNVTKRATSDPPATYKARQVISKEPYNEIPDVVTIEATSSDDISELRDPYVEGPNKAPRPMTFIPDVNHAFFRNKRTHCCSPAIPTVCEGEDWPSDEESETGSKGSMTCSNLCASGLNLCGLGDCLIGSVPDERAENKRDDDTEKGSSTRDMALTCSGSSYVNSFSQDHTHLTEDVNHRDECDPPGFAD